MKNLEEAYCHKQKMQYNVHHRKNITLFFANNPYNKTHQCNNTVNMPRKAVNGKHYICKSRKCTLHIKPLDYKNAVKYKIKRYDKKTEGR